MLYIMIFLIIVIFAIIISAFFGDKLYDIVYKFINYFKDEKNEKGENENE